ASTIAGATLGGATGIKVTVETPTGNPVTTDTSAVTLTLSSGTFSTGTNQATVAAINGVANFTNLAINAPGSSYTITATDGSLPPATSSPFNVYQFDNISSLVPYPYGENPQSNVIMDASGDTFGTTYQGGAYGDGTVFEIAAGSNLITTLASFN